MKIGVVLFVVLMAYASADCGCLKCSRHLQGVDVPGPAGRPVKVIFRRPKPPGCGCGCCCGCEASNEPPPNQITKLPDVLTPGGQYSAKVQLPLPKLPKARLPLKNLKYRTDTILVPPPSIAAATASSTVDPGSLTTLDILKWLSQVRLVAQQQQQGQQQIPTVVPQLTVETVPCACQQCTGNPSLTTRSSTTGNEMLQCANCQRSKRETSEDRHSKTIFSSNQYVRPKRDLTKRGYNFFMNMLPQSIREPLHHSVQGSNYLKQSVPKLTLAQKLDELKIKKATESIFNQLKPQTQSPLANIFNKPFKSAYAQTGLNHFQLPKPFTQPSLDQYSNHASSFQLNAAKSKLKDSLFIPTNPLFESSKKFPKLSLSNQQFPLLENKPKLTLPFAKTAPSPPLTVDPILENTYKTFLRKYGLDSPTIPNLSQRVEDREGADEKALLKKLKKLNNNPYTSNLEDQATAFIEQLLKPSAESQRIHKRSVEDKRSSRAKRTIILGSDEIDLPAHYEIEMVSVEDESEENEPEEVEPYEEFEEQDPFVGASPFMRKSALPQMYYPRLPSLQPRPEIVLGKNVIQKAVREELEAHHRKVERDQKVKEMKENLKRKKQQSLVPQNPIFALLTAPVNFLKHFHSSPVISTIPKLVYTTKKVFKDLGKNFQRNCLDLASNVIGDFDHIHPTVIQHIVEPDGRRYRRDVADLRTGLKYNQKNTAKRVKIDCRNDILKALKSEEVSSEANMERLLVPIVVVMKKGNKMCCASGIDSVQSGDVANDTGISEDDQKPQSANHLANINEVVEHTSSELMNEPSDIQPEAHHFAPDYTLVFKNSQENTNFHVNSEEHVRKKRYVVRVVDDSHIQDQVQDYLTQKLEDQPEYLNPLQDYYDKVNGLLDKLYSSHQPLCQVGGECYYQRSAPAEEEIYEDQQVSSESMMDESFEEKPRKKKIQVRKMKPRVIIDNNGRPFMEYNGYKRPLKLNRNKVGTARKSGPRSGSSSEETGSKITTLIARARGDSEVVGNAHKEIIPQKIVKERISSLLEEIDQLVNLNVENYDDIFEDLIKIEHIKTSIEQDWKRMLIKDRVNDARAKVSLLSKFKDLQHLKDGSVKKIAAALKKNDNEFVRCQLVNSLMRLQKLQVLITSVVEDFEQHLKMKTSFNTKKEIKYIDYLSDLKFASAKTRNDLLKMLCKDRDSEGLKNMEMLHKLKKLLIASDEDPEKFDEAAKLLWEMKNLEKLQMETINDMNRKLARNLRVKKEVKILVDLQRRFEDCNKELSEFLGAGLVKSNAAGQKKDIKEVIAEVKKRHEDMMQKVKGRSGSLFKKG